MAVVLSLFMVYMIMAITFALDLGLAPGLSIKNAVLYMLLMLVFFRFVLRGGFKLDMLGIPMCLALLVAYAMGSTIAVALLDIYSEYSAVGNLMWLKGAYFDFLMFYLLFFYGITNEKQGLTVLKSILLVAIFANVTTVLNGLGVIYISTIPDLDSESGRIQGVMGEQNQTGAYIALFIPPLLAAAAQSKGLVRALWAGGALASAMALTMTISRGAFVALFLAILIGIYLFREYVSAQRLVGWGAAAVGTVVLIGISLGPSFGRAVVERLASIGSGDSMSASSGRTDLWGAMLELMTRVPSTLITGYGWRSYDRMPLDLAPHNSYLGLWFELGLPGVLLFTAALAQLVIYAKRAVARASETMRAHFIAFVVGVLALMISIFFVELYTPWPFFWAYAGVMMRLVIISRESEVQSADTTAKASASPQASAPEPSFAFNQFGWKARARR